MHKVYQIFYSEETKVQNDRGFLQLDNIVNNRPDWREYWPIRQYLLLNKLDPDTFYGFFSPKFHKKTGLTSEKVYEFIDDNSDSDIITFSPFFDQSAFYLNVFEQAHQSHSDSLPTFKSALYKIYGDDELIKMVMSSNETVFCNYFVAKPKFWNEWLRIAETIFQEAENNTTQLSAMLNSNTTHDRKVAPRKVFIIERIASCMLALQYWKKAPYNMMKLNHSSLISAKYKTILYVLDSLKMSYIQTKNQDYLDKFYEVRKGLILRINKK
jgi:hypothetical protein